MSYILDALRKAERERSLGQPPGAADIVQSAPLPAASPSRPLFRWAAAIGLLLLGAAFAWFVLSRTEPAVNVVVDPAPVARPTPPEPEPLEAQSLVPAQSPPVPAVDESEPLATLDDVADAERIEEQEADVSDTAAAAEPIAPPAPDDQAAQAPAEPAAPAGASESPVPGVPALREMPSDFRYSFPALGMQVHVYDELPEKRWLLIDGKRYAEGTSLSQGPRVIEIVPDGVVFEHRGQRVFVPRSR